MENEKLSKQKKKHVFNILYLFTSFLYYHCCYILVYKILQNILRYIPFSSNIICPEFTLNYNLVC